MKLGSDMCRLNTFNIPKHEGVNEWAGGGATKKPPENAMKLRESRLSHHLKPIQIMLKRRRFFHCHPQPSNSSVARIKFYFQICTPTVIRTVPSCFLLNL